MPEAIVIGAGLAGLCCARTLAEAGVEVLVLEAGDAVGGRARSEVVDGFLIDRGFQVFLTAYPEARRVLDYDALGFRHFYSGALVHVPDGAGGGALHRVADPLRHPIDAARAFLSPVASLPDKLAIARLDARYRLGAEGRAFEEPDVTSLEALREAGVSEGAIDRFFRAFFGGVFFDRDLRTSARMLAFTYRMFATGRASLPEGGMGAIARQIADRLPPGTVRLGTPVASVPAGGGSPAVTLADGSAIAARAVVIATDGATAEELAPGFGRREWVGTVTAWYAADRAPVEEGILVLSGGGPADGPVNHLAVPSLVQPRYAPPGRHVIAANVVGGFAGDDAELDAAIRGQMGRWFAGRGVEGWRLLRVHRIDRALPAQPPGVLEPAERGVRVGAGRYVCGDHRDNASINGAMVSGRRAAEAVISDLRGA